MKIQELTKKWKLVLTIGIISVLLLTGALFVYFRDMQIAYHFIDSGSKIIKTPIGTVEYTAYGTGKPVLISHGAGGGFDQGKLIAKILGKGYRFILPSRFGYLRSKTNLTVTARLQADAYSYILKDLGISKVSVVGFSAGGPPALSFAAHHADLCENLVMMSAISTAISNSKDDPVKTKAFKLLYKSNFIYWSVTKVFRSNLLSLYGLTKLDQQRFSKFDKQMIADFFYTTMPASLREPGILNDQKMILPSTREVNAIKMPVLILHVKQDPLISFKNAEYSHNQITGSILIPFDNGGHFLMGHHQEIAAKIRTFIYH